MFSGKNDHGKEKRCTVDDEKNKKRDQEEKKTL